MAVFDEDIGTDLTPDAGDCGATFKRRLRSDPDNRATGNDRTRSSPAAATEPVRPPRDWQLLYERAHARAERERARADAAAARAEELRWAEVDSRARAGSLKWQLGKSRNKLTAAVEETKEARRAARDVPSLQGEVARLETLLCEAGIKSNESSTIEALRKEVARLRKALVAPEAREGVIGPRPADTRRQRTALARLPQLEPVFNQFRRISTGERHVRDWFD